jgi:hypothetical protein
MSITKPIASALKNIISRALLVPEAPTGILNRFCFWIQDLDDGFASVIAARRFEN